MTREISPERLTASDDVEECAQMMASSEPWTTLGRDAASARGILSDAARDVFVLRDDAGITAFVILDMRGTFSGYIQTICVRSDQRGRGVGGELLDWAERRIFRDRPNVFLCVSSFNEGARRLYERRGYEVIGILRGFLVPEHDEILMRKTLGSWSAFRPERESH